MSENDVFAFLLIYEGLEVKFQVIISHIFGFVCADYMFYLHLMFELMLQYSHFLA
jgi:hypothetical protein